MWVVGLLLFNSLASPDIEPRNFTAVITVNSIARGDTAEHLVELLRLLCMASAFGVKTGEEVLRGYEFRFADTPIKTQLRIELRKSYGLRPAVLVSNARQRIFNAPFFKN